jgi:exodeoxyribonuclease V alpha subunit
LAAKTPVTLEGTVERITYYNEGNHYTVARLQVGGRRGTVSIVGRIPCLRPGETLRVSGYFEEHPQYGPQLRVEDYQTVQPATLQGIERYLGSGLIKGIGPETAKRIVKRFGLGTLEIIEKDINRLAQVEGIGPKRIDQIRKAWKEQKAIRQLMIFLQGYGVGIGLASKIFKAYGPQAVGRIRENPYALADEVFGVGFLTADRMAQKMGMEKESPFRLQAGILHILKQKAEEGQVCLPETELLLSASSQLEVDEELLRPILKDLIRKKQLVLRKTPEGEGLVFLSYLDSAEEGIARRLRELGKGGVRQASLIPDLLEKTEALLGLTLSKEQKKAVATALAQKVLIITGGPGTGKTTVIRAILEVFRSKNRRCVLLAPTGRAAKRLSEVTRFPAATIHRGLQYNPKTGTFQRNEGHPLAGDLVVVDEASMIDTYLMYHLLKAVPDGAVLILVGDVFQLPSVGPGNVLSDIIASERVPVISLDRIFRQGEGSMITVNAHRIHRGEMPLWSDPGDPSGDFHFLNQEDPETAARWILELVRDRLPKRYGLDPLQDIQVLTPMYRGQVGAENLNVLLQRHLNRNEKTVERGSRVFKLGDKVMQIRNNYEKEVFNGDIGRIVKVDEENQEVWVNFDGRFVVYDYNDLEELVLAYAVSVHKSQGGEYPAVVMPVMIQHYLLLQRNLIYTAVTRAKRVVVLVGTKKALAIGIKNNKPQLRYSFLKERLCGVGRLDDEGA